MGYWILQLLGWGLYFYAQASGEVIFAQVPWSKASTLWGGVCLAGIALTHLLRWVIRRRGWLALKPAALMGRVLIAVLLISVVAYLNTIALSEAVYGTPVTPITQAFYQRLSVGGQLRNQFIFMLVAHGAWAAVYLAITIQRHRHRAEVHQAQLGEALRAAELRLLKSQLNPHFLFNALNGLRSLIAEDPARARDAVTQLARTMRYSLAAGEEDLVSLERELEMVDDYLALESLRHEERLKIERDIDPAARSARLPAMLLQTLVENAIKHGIAQLKSGGVLRIVAQVGGGELLIRVSNPRSQIPPADSGSEGVGLRNASQRLRLMYGEGARLELDLSASNQAIAEVRLPA
ncbi:MAG TPA: histidine kinase [Steroidobacteraceae bacterium]|nr:histidine kinase [Steroidobacteraceae bacterium]